MKDYLAETPEDSILGTILSGFIVKRGDLEICDLDFHRNNYSDKPRIQVYKSHLVNKKTGKAMEYCKIFYNYKEAVKNFIELSKGN